MKEVEVVRKVDPMGRIGLPLVIREALGISPKDPLRISIQDGCIMLRPMDNRCVFCHTPLENSGGTIAFSDRQICVSCAQGIADAARKQFEAMAAGFNIHTNTVRIS